MVAMARDYFASRMRPPLTNVGVRWAVRARTWSGDKTRLLTEGATIAGLIHLHDFPLSAGPPFSKHLSTFPDNVLEIKAHRLCRVHQAKSNRHCPPSDGRFGRHQDKIPMGFDEAKHNGRAGECGGKWRGNIPGIPRIFPIDTWGKQAVTFPNPGINIYGKATCGIKGF